MLKDVIRLIKESGLLNASWYEVQYPDVKILGMDPIEHYLRYGEQLGRRPGPDFDPQAYLSAYPEVKKFGNSVLLHFIKHGVSEGRKAGLSKKAIDSIFGSSCSSIKTERENKGRNISKPAAFDDKRITAEIKFIKESKFFDERYYKENNRDVVFNKVDCIEHYVKWGAFEGRNPHPLFNSAIYVQSNPKVLESGINPLVHYLKSAFRNDRDPIPVPLLSAKPLKNKPVKVIAFYLPQFHPIAENDRWWGNGFTEWTNVKDAEPQFPRHYQPRLPGELGYYDLRDQGVQKRQVELAHLYGIGGFCFYFYWFAGKRLLELPINNYAKNKELDLPFCLCWANENWSRRWDGLENDILIAQKHSPEDDFYFIEYISSYLKNPKYIRIGGKPLLIVYRPSLLPSPEKTADCWRSWCNKNGIGDIYIAYTQSFEKENPKEYGFDGAIEFPPNNTGPACITDQIEGLNKSFTGEIYDMGDLVNRSNTHKPVDYPLFRGVCPWWDNTARRKSNGVILANCSPIGYQRWLFNAIQDSTRRFQNVDERIVFVNAWNEWAEGAYLEPDQKYGYAFLEATRMAIVRSSINTVNLLPDRHHGLAVIIHAFYPEVLPDIFDYMRNFSKPFKLFITTSPDKIDAVKDYITNYKYPHMIIMTKNKGRDVLPFIIAAKHVISQGYKYFLKIHTKKSTHRVDGDHWRNDIYNKLLNPSLADSIGEYLTKNQNVGIVGPNDHIVPMAYYWGSNKERVMDLASRLGVNSTRLLAETFAAGTMFYARIDAILPLLNLAIGEDDFEDENGQVDGTLAHAIERIFSISAVSLGLKVVSTQDIVTGNNDLLPTTNYAFADATS